MSTQLNLAILATLDAKGIVAGAAEVRKELDAVTKSAKAGSDASIAASQGSARAAREAAAANRAVSAAVAGRGADELAMLRAAEAATTGTAKSTALAAHEVTNLTRQFADLGVMLASGQSPMMAMITQGPQIADIFGRRGLSSILPGIAAGLMSLINPTTLALAAITALGYGASVVFGSMRGDVADIEKLVAEHEDTVRRLKDAWGEAASGIRPYASESRAVLDLISRAGAEQRREALRAATPAAIAGITSSVDVSEFGGARAFRSSEAFKLLREELDALRKSAVDGIPDFISFQRRMAELEKTDPSPQVRKLAVAAIEATKAVADLQRTLPEAQVDFRPGRQRDDIGSYLRDPDRPTVALPNSAPTPERRVDPYFWPAEAKAPELPKVERQTRSLIQTQKEQLLQLQLERQLVGGTRVERELLTAALEAELEIRRLGIDVQGEEAEAIRRNARAIAEQTLEVDANAEAWRRAQRAAESMIDGVVDRLMSGDWEGALESLARDIAGTLGEIGVKNPLKEVISGEDLPTFDDYGGLGGFVNAMLGRGRKAAATPATFSPTSDGFLKSMGIDRGAGVEPVIRMTLAPVGARSAIGGDQSGYLSGFLASGRPASYIRDMSAELQTGLSAMLRDAPASIRSAVSITSGARSIARQAELWEGALAKYGSAEAARRWVAPPGSSQHNFGRAADLGFGTSAARDWFHANAEAYGMKFPMRHEPWHIETANARSKAPNPALDALMGKANSAAQAVDRLATNATGAAGAAGELGTGMTQVAKAMTSAPAGTGGGSGGGGGFFDFLAKLFGGGAPAAAPASIFTRSPRAGFDLGGFTGFGNPHDVAGLVHRKEYVFSAPAVEAIGLPTLDALHRAGKSGRGFAEGGYAEGSFRMPGAGRSGRSGDQTGGREPTGVEITLVNETGVPMRSSRETRPDGKGGKREVVVLREMVADALTARGSPARGALGSVYGAEPRRPVR